MEDVIEITLCVNNTVCHRPITGMLLRYNDRRRASVGKIRFDWELQRVVVNQTKNLLIGCNMDERGDEYVADMNIVPPTDRSYMHSWLDISWNGTLEWYFTPYRAHLSYNGNYQGS